MDLVKCSLSGLLFVSAALFGAEIPLAPADDGTVVMPGYEQKFTVTFDSEDAAQKAELVVRPLPKRYQMVLSARWDDSTESHRNTLKLMKKNGIFGTFFFSGVDPKMQKLGQEIYAAGSSVGLHTNSHPSLPTLTPNLQFYEYLQNKVDIETGLNHPATVQALPFCQFRTEIPDCQNDMGKILRSAGVLAAPDVFYPVFWKELGYKFNQMAEAKVVRPGDKIVNRTHFDTIFAAAKKVPAMEFYPALSFAMHSWHTPESLVELDKIFHDYGHNPDYWYCNHNQYGAYFHESRNVKISRQINGSSVTFTVSRFRPEELGANEPLWFEVKNAAPQSVSANAVLQDGLICLAHAPEYRETGLFALAEEDGTVAKISGLKVKLLPAGRNTWKMAVENHTGSALKDVYAMFHFPPQYPAARAFTAAPEIAGGTSADVAIRQNAPSDAVRFACGETHYYGALNFTWNGKRCRVYAHCVTPAPKNPPVTLAAVCDIIDPFPKEAKGEALSVPGSRINLKVCANHLAEKTACGTVLFKEWGAFTKNMIGAVAEFESGSEGDAEVIINAHACYFNGEYLPHTRGGKQTIRLRKGTNRIVFVTPDTGLRSARFYFVKPPKITYHRVDRKLIPSETPVAVSDVCVIAGDKAYFSIFNRTPGNLTATVNLRGGGMTGKGMKKVTIAQDGSAGVVLPLKKAKSKSDARILLMAGGKILSFAPEILRVTPARPGEVLHLNNADFSFEIKDGELFLRAKVKDGTMPGAAQLAGSPWEQDCVEFFFDYDFGKFGPKKEGAYTPSVFRLFYTPRRKAGECLTGMFHAKGPVKRKNVQILRESSGADGYEFTLAIPLPAGKKQIGFAVKVNDFSDGSTKNNTAVYGSSGPLHRNRYLFGVLELQK